MPTSPMILALDYTLSLAILLTMEDGVRPSQLKFNRVQHESYKQWSAYSKAADGSSFLPSHCIDLKPLLTRIPAFLASGRLSHGEPFSFACQEREAHGKYGLLISGHSVWRTSNGHCGTEPKIVPLKLLLAIQDPLKIQFSDNGPLAEWPGVQGISAHGKQNHTTLLFLACAYILSSKWVDLLRHSPRHACQTKYTAEAPIRELLEFNTGYEIDENEDRWWKAILSFGWEIKTHYEGRTYLSPWSVTASNMPFSSEKQTPCVELDTPSWQTAMRYVTRFCGHHGLYDQFSASLAAALYIPLLSGTTIPLLMPKNIAMERKHIPESGLSIDSNSHLISGQSKLLPYYMTLSCNTFGMRSLLCSTFFNGDVECNLASAWLQPCFSIIDPLIKGEDFAKIAVILGNRQPNVAALWLGAIIVGIAKSVIREIHIGLTALDVHAAAWTSTTQSFISVGPGKVDGEIILREDECRLLFILSSEGHTRPPRSPWKPFGSVRLIETDLEVQRHAKCDCHCLEYLKWYWESSDGGKTLEDTGLTQSPTPKYSKEREQPGHSPGPYLFDECESLSEIATRGIFEWLRSNGYPASENFIYQHSWLDIGSSDGEEIDGDESEDEIVDQQRRKARIRKWIMETDIIE